MTSHLVVLLQNATRRVGALPRGLLDAEDARVGGAELDFACGGHLDCRLAPILECGRVRMFRSDGAAVLFWYLDLDLEESGMQ